MEQKKNKAKGSSRIEGNWQKVLGNKMRRDLMPENIVRTSDAIYVRDE